MLEQIGTNGGQKVAKNFDCTPCLYSCKKESDWTKHISTRKHKNRTKVAILEQTGEKVAGYGADLPCKSKSGEKLAVPIMVCDCGKQYTARNSFWYHKKHCYVHQVCISENSTQKNEISSGSQQIVYLGHKADSLIKSTASFMKGTSLEADIDKAKDVEFKELVMLLLKENKEIQKTFVDLLPHIKGHNSEHSFNTTNTNSNNTNNFNIQMFLNEQCKNAMNLTEFNDSLPITADTYDNTIENGLTKTITTMITTGLNNMDITDSKSILRRNKKTVERGFCNWIIPHALIQGQYPGMTPESYGPSSKECQVHIQNMIQQAKVTCFCCLQTEVPSQDDDIGWKHGEVYLEPEYVRRQFPRPFTRYGTFAQSQSLTATQITFIHQPIEDLDVPNNDSLLSLLTRLLQHLEDDNSTIYLHCWGGRGRAGIIGSCLTILLFPELSSCDILNWIQKGYESRAGAESMSEGLKRSPQTAQQRQFVKDFVDIVHKEIVEEYPMSTC